MFSGSYRRDESQHDLARDPALVERGIRGGPTAEERPAQKVIMLFTSPWEFGKSTAPSPMPLICPPILAGAVTL